jgi:signal recognition particle subunit SRP54
MFDGLATRFEKILRNLRSSGRITDEVLKESLREIRLALLEADVNYKVVKEFTTRVAEKAAGRELIPSLSPGQQIVKIVHDELAALLGGEPKTLAVTEPHPFTILMVGLQGSGKTTTCGKLALYLKKTHDIEPLLVAADTHRPAAVEQLKVIAARIGVPIVFPQPGWDARRTVREGMMVAAVSGAKAVIVDTAGRLHVDDDLMAELADLKKDSRPRATLLVADAMTGQDAVTMAEAFNSRIGVEGIVLTKLDGDSRGGAALSVVSVTGRPVYFAGVGEKDDALEPFSPVRMAGRILGMGDVVSLVEKVQATVSQEQAAKMEAKLRKSEFTLEDFRDQMKQISSMGSIKDLLAMIPGAGAKLKDITVDEKVFVRYSAIIDSMTPRERRDPTLLERSRRIRVAKGSGTSPEEVGRLVKQFLQAKKMMGKMMRGGKMMGGGKFPFRRG